MQQQITVTTEQKEALADLDALIAFGNAWITKTADNPRRISGLGDRKKLLLSISIAVHSHVDAISHLLKSGRTHSSEVILRGVLEGYINAAYILSANNDSRAADYIFTETSLKLGNYKKMQAYRKEHPNYDTEQGTLSDEDIQRGIDETAEALAEIKRKYPKVKGVGLKDKVAAIDAKFSQRMKHYRPMEWSYFHTYYILCKSSHVTFDSLFSLFERDGDALSLYIGGNPKRISLLILGAYVFYLDMLNMFLPRFGGKNSELKRFDEVLERLKV